MPKVLMTGVNNWTQEVRNGTIVYSGRKESLDEIAAIIKRNRHPILIGPSRTGKSATAKAFAKAIERGDYPELKGMSVFYINTATICNFKEGYTQTGASMVLNHICKQMGRHADKIIIVFDEIHNACKETSNLAEILKPYLDEHGRLPHIIGITTEQEYNTNVKRNVAFSNRFDKVDIKNTEEERNAKNS